MIAMRSHDIGLMTITCGIASCMLVSRPPMMTSNVV